jgi:diguanylate cyclase (GGDEF)-like protein
MEPSYWSRPAGYVRLWSFRLRWYGLALALSALALGLMVLLRPLLEPSVFLLFVAAVAISALYGGLGPGLLATVLSALVSNFFFLPPLYPLLGGTQELVRISIFMSVGLIISWLAEVHKKDEEQLRTLIEELERRAAERLALQSQLEYNATHDHLTDLLNRGVFYEHLAHALTRARRHGTKVALLLMDLDNFKAINDSFGHRSGDKALVEVAERLKRSLRESDVAARLGGDEFTVLLEDVIDASQALRAAERLQTQLRAPLGLGGHRRLQVSASIGIAVSAEQQPEELMDAADQAMYQAKSRGKAQSVVFDPGATDGAV